MGYRYVQLAAIGLAFAFGCAPGGDSRRTAPNGGAAPGMTVPDSDSGSGSGSSSDSGTTGAPDSSMFGWDASEPSAPDAGVVDMTGEDAGVMDMDSGAVASDAGTDDASMPMDASLPPASADWTLDVFPGVADLALIVPTDDARIRATDVMPVGWLRSVRDALYASELDEDVSLESFDEDWKLVSARFVTCSPLGKIADRAEIDRLCWPQVRLVWQPIVHRIRIFGIIRPDYADDRAIHTLYRVSHNDPSLQEVLTAIEGGARLTTLDPGLLARFETARNAAGLVLLRALLGLRDATTGYTALDTRPELNDWSRSDAFYTRLNRMLTTFCPTTALHELTAFSLPMGRMPASSDLWSFVAFSASGGTIRQTTLDVYDPNNGMELFSFPGSEDVTTGLGDHELTEALPLMTASRRSRLEALVITDTDQVPTLAPRINDPYQTLVPNTTCSSCHRMNGLLFNFHNLSYLEDHEVTIAPRVRQDISRDLGLARALWSTAP